MPATPKKKLAPKRERTRAKILDVTQQLLANTSYHDLSFVDIAYEAEMSPGSVYNYYPDSKAIAEDIVSMAIAVFNRHLDTATADLDNPVERVILSSQLTLMCGLPDSSVGKLFFDYQLPDASFVEFNKQRSLRDLQPLIQSGELVLDAPELTMSLATGAFRAAMLDLYEGRIRAGDIAEVVKVFLRMLNVNLPPSAITLSNITLDLPPLPFSALEWLPPLPPK